MQRFNTQTNANFQKNLPRPAFVTLALKYSKLFWITENFTCQRKSWNLFSIQRHEEVILPWFLEWYIHNNFVKFVWDFNHARHTALLSCIAYFSYQQTLLQMKIHGNPQRTKMLMFTVVLPVICNSMILEKNKIQLNSFSLF